MTQLEPSIFDSRPIAAIGLGFFTRFYGTDALSDCLLTLSNDIYPNVFTSLNRLMAKIDAYFDESEFHARENHSNLPPTKGEFLMRAAWEVTTLGRFADHAFPDYSPLGWWYRVGAALGDCELADQDDKLAPEDLRSVVAYLRQLPEAYRSALAVVDRLLKIEELSQPNHVFEQAVGQDAEPASRFVNTRNSMIVGFAYTLIEQVSQLELSLQDDSQDARDRWLYEQLRAEVPHKTIIARLKAFKEWEPITSKAGITAAVKRFCARKLLLLPDKRGPGRPRRKK